MTSKLAQREIKIELILIFELILIKMAPIHSFPRIFIRNSENILCQIIRNDKEKKIFNKISPFRKCLITDILNFNAWEKGEAPYNQLNIHFAIESNYYEAFTGNKF